jgi:uncharacterized integral membrane protein (TIGR00698 family)
VRLRTTFVARILFLVLALATLVPWVTASMGLALGIAVALVLENPYAKATKTLTPWLLQTAVVGMGFGMDLRVVAAAGLHGVGYTLAGIALCCAAGLGLRALLRVAKDVGLLVTVGTAICGGSAIAAVVPAIGANDDDASVSLGVVFVLNAVGLLVFPLVGHALGLDEPRFGVWAALAIHDTSSVVGAASQYGRTALEIATTIKLARSLWIVPLAVFIGWWRTRGAGRARAVRRPWFIAGFIGAAAIATFVPHMAAPGIVVARVARQLMVLTLFCIGAGLSRQALAKVGARPLALGVLLWLFVALSTLGAIRAGLITG